MVLVLGALACAGPLAPPEREPEGTAATLHTPLPKPSEAPSPASSTAPTATTPASGGARYTNASAGLSMWYPEGWIYREAGTSVVFGTSEDVINYQKMTTGAGMNVIVGDLEGLTLEDMVAMFAPTEEAEPQVEVGQREARTIAGQQGMFIPLQGTFQGEEVPTQGLIAAFEYEGWGYLFFGLSVRDEWAKYGPALEAMLESVQVSPRVG